MKDLQMSQQAYTLETQIVKSVRLNYLLFLPKDYGKNPQKRWPLILFLHGAGERGDDLELVKLHGIPKVVEQREDFPFIAVSPQCPVDSWWSAHIEELDALLNEVVASYAVDTDRLYLTGLSMGGYGTWHLAATYPQRFAALTPICGGGPWFAGFPEKVSVLKDVPIWVFHGAQDDVVSLEESERMVDALRACGSSVRFTVYPDADHDSWTETYDNPELYEWFLQHTRRESGTASHDLSPSLADVRGHSR
jgi:predicted peptidase